MKRWLRWKASVYNMGDLGSIPGSGSSLEKETATHSSTLAQKIPWTEEPGVHGVAKSWTRLSDFTFLSFFFFFEKKCGLSNSEDKEHQNLSFFFGRYECQYLCVYMCVCVFNSNSPKLLVYNKHSINFCVRCYTFSNIYTREHITQQQFLCFLSVFSGAIFVRLHIVSRFALAFP